METAVFAALVLVAPASGCGGSSPQATMATDGSFLTCALPYQPGMQVMSSAGTFTIKLLDSTPGPPVKGPNTWTLEIDDASSGVALDGVVLSVTPWMPDHNHGTTPVGVTPAGSGTYTLAPVYLYMSGLWQIKMTVAAAAVGDGGTTDNAALPICIP